MTAEQKKVIIIAETARKIKAIEAGPGDAVTKKANIDARIAKRDADLTAVDYEELKKASIVCKSIRGSGQGWRQNINPSQGGFGGVGQVYERCTALKTLMDQVQKN